MTTPYREKNRFQLFVPYSLFSLQTGDGILFLYKLFLSKIKKILVKVASEKEKKLDPFFPEPHDCTQQNRNLTFIYSSHEIHVAFA
jgi:hypothetical protein